MNAIEIVNASVNAAQDQFAGLAPATKTNLIQIGEKVLSTDATRNAFLNNMIEIISKQIVHDTRVVNTLSQFRKGTKAIGNDVQEIYTSLIKGEDYNVTVGDKLLSRKFANVKAAYHKRNRRDMYQLTVSNAELKTAFLSVENMETLISRIISTLSASDENDQFQITKNMIGLANRYNRLRFITTPVMVEQDIGTATVTAAEGAPVKDFVKSIKKVVAAMKFRSTKMNSYNLINPTDVIPVETLTPLDNIVMIIRADVLVEAEVEVLAMAFNLSLADFRKHLIEVDNFGIGGENIYCVVCDEAFINIVEDLYNIDSQYIAGGMYTNYFLNHWETYYLSLFVNGVAIGFTLPETVIKPIIGNPMTNSYLYNDSTGIHIDCATTDAKIYYTIDGSTPDESSELYSENIHLSVSQLPLVMKAIAVKDGLNVSDVASRSIVATVE